MQFVGDGYSESAVRLAVALELREVDIPGDPDRPGDTPEEVSLHIRLEGEDGALVVLLWDRGEFVGKRRVSRSTSARVLARRVGLAVGELARQLSSRRSRRLQQLQRDTFLAEEQEKEFERQRRLRDLGILAELRALGFAEGAYLLGPSVGLEFNDYFPLRFSTGLSWMTGAIPALSENTLGQTNPGWSAFDFWFRMDHMWQMTEPSWVSAGLEVAASAIHVSGSTEVDDIRFQRDTHTARLGARLGYGYSLTQSMRGRLELSGGSLLRSIPMKLGDERLALGGGYLGLNLGVTIAPKSDPR